MDIIAIKEFFSYYRPYKKLFALDFISSLLAGMVELAMPLLVIWIADTAIPSKDIDLIVLGALGMLAIIITLSGLTYIINYWGHVLGVRIEADMRHACYAHLNKLSFTFFDDQKTGHLVARITKDLENIGELAHHGPEDIFIALITFLGAVIFMLYNHTTMGICIALSAPFFIIVNKKYGYNMGRIWKRTMEQIGVFNQRIEETVGGIRVVKSFTNEPHEMKLFNQDNQKYVGIKRDFYHTMGINLAQTTGSVRFVHGFVLILGSYYVIQDEMTIGQLMGFAFLVGVFIRPIEKIMNLTEMYSQGMAGFSRFREFMAIQPDITDSPNAQPLTKLKTAITFNNVDFAYAGHTVVLNNITLTIPMGKTTAFVGKSGSGKSTICSLIPRFYDRTGGSICFDGTDVKNITLDSLRNKIGVVEQDTFLFAGTLRDNVAYGKLGATDTEIMTAIEQAHLTEMVTNLPDGLNTMVGERGVKLSGGQKQRIAIARVFLKNPEILILDEATSALDTQSEIAIQQALTKLAQGRTTIIIAHRLSTVKNADQIIVLNNGKIAEQGTHKTLMQQTGTYKTLVKAQQLT